MGKPELVICGIGNPWRKDDGAGIEVAKELSTKYRVFFCETTPERFIDDICKIKPKRLVIVDAASFDGKPGQIKKIKPEHIDGQTISTHTIPISLFIEFIKKCCGHIEIWGIRAKDTAFGNGLSKEVQEGVKKLVEKISR